MTQKRTRFIVAAATLGILAACNNSDLTPVTAMFGQTMQAAFALTATDEPLTSAQIQGLATEVPVSLTTEPVDL